MQNNLLSSLVRIWGNRRQPLRYFWFDGVLGRSGSSFNGGQGLNPLVLSSAPFPLPQPHATFVSSHNVCQLNPIPGMRPAETTNWYQEISLPRFPSNKRIKSRFFYLAMVEEFEKGRIDPFVFLP
jgi:hypothetical protein